MATVTRFCTSSVTHSEHTVARLPCSVRSELFELSQLCARRRPGRQRGRGEVRQKITTGIHACRRDIPEVEAKPEAEVDENTNGGVARF